MCNACKTLTYIHLSRWQRMMQGKSIKPDPFKRMEGSDVSLEWLETDPTALTEPIVVEKPDGLGMKMPEELTVSDVAEIVGENTPVEVIGTMFAPTFVASF